jgi:hypothetical protein
MLEEFFNIRGQYFLPITRILISLPDAFQRSPALGCEQNVRGPRSAYHRALGQPLCEL